MIRGEEGDTSQMGVSYEVRIHIADSIDDYDGSKKNTVCMNIRKVSTYLCMYVPRNRIQMLVKIRLKVLCPIRVLKYVWH